MRSAEYGLTELLDPNVAIYHCSMKAVSRGGGRSATAAAAYRAAERIEDQREMVVHDYQRRSGVEHTELVGAGERTRSELWNQAEAAERRGNAVVAREIVVALPDELSPTGRINAVREFAAELHTRYDVAVDLAVHGPSSRGDQRNHHAHLLFTTRVVSEEGFGAKTRVLDDRRTGPEQVREIRTVWEQITNRHLEREGRAERIDARSYADQGLDRAATVHLGPAVTNMERAGVPSRLGDHNREVQRINLGPMTIFPAGYERTAGETAPPGVRFGGAAQNRGGDMRDTTAERTSTTDRPGDPGAARDPAVAAIVVDVRIYTRIKELEGERHKALEELGTAKMESARLDRADEAVRKATATFDRVFAEVYRDAREGRSARVKFEEMAGKEGVGRALQELEGHPEQFGRLATVREPRFRLPFAREANDSHARQLALRAAADGRAAHEIRSQAPTEEAITRAAEAVKAATEKVSAINAQLKHLPERGVLEQRIARSMEKLSPAQRTEVLRSLPGPQVQIVTRLALQAARSQTQVLER